MPGKGDVEMLGGGDEQAAVDEKVLAALQSKLLSQAVLKDQATPASFIKGLPESIQKRIKALKKLQSEAAHIESKFYKECHELEVKYSKELESFATKRCHIVSGEVDPSEAECDWPYDVEEQDDGVKLNGDKETEKPESEQKVAEGDVKGIPDFWLTIFQKSENLAIMLQEHDEPILKHLNDVKVDLEGGDNPGFTLHFYFSPNDYFTNDVLSKEYKLKLDPTEGADSLEYDGPEIISSKGCEINWKEGKDVTKKVVKKKQRNKKSGQIREVKSTQPAESFFRFFTPPEMSGSFEDMDEETQEELSSDFELGQVLREHIVPKAVMYYTGEAADGDWDEDSDEDDDDADAGDDDDDDDDDVDEE